MCEWADAWKRMQQLWSSLNRTETHIYCKHINSHVKRNHRHNCFRNENKNQFRKSFYLLFRTEESERKRNRWKLLNTEKTLWNNSGSVHIKNKQSGTNSFPLHFQEIDMPLQLALFTFEGLFRWRTIISNKWTSAWRAHAFWADNVWRQYIE